VQKPRSRISHAWAPLTQVACTVLPFNSLWVVTGSASGEVYVRPARQGIAGTLVIAFTSALIRWDQGVTKRCRLSWLTNSALVI
jgi:hypothetical protein